MVEHRQHKVRELFSARDLKIRKQELSGLLFQTRNPGCINAMDVNVPIAKWIGKRIVELRSVFAPFLAVSLFESEECILHPSHLLDALSFWIQTIQPTR